MRKSAMREPRMRGRCAGLIAGVDVGEGCRERNDRRTGDRFADDSRSECDRVRDRIADDVVVVFELLATAVRQRAIVAVFAVTSTIAANSRMILNQAPRCRRFMMPSVSVTNWAMSVQ